ncbi:hypothetical protein JPH1_52210 (plasmid) [Mycobacterium avium subsp. hominissuis]|uniref:Uncharacterized protein n=1 Tax=Mycobacterium avium subsp. hominissuis TaxID=439334 RepID=A0AAI8X598_MYCAV|nr:hypothetical protein JPH1_52210 [Mycobacterium avium subsp. hominissuis]
MRSRTVVAASSGSLFANIFLPLAALTKALFALEGPNRYGRKHSAVLESRHGAIGRAGVRASELRTAPAAAAHAAKMMNLQVTGAMKVRYGYYLLTLWLCV